MPLDGTRRGWTRPFDLLARICALIPPPRLNMVRYHGVLSSHAKLRAEVVPSPPEPEPDPLQLQTELPRCVEPDEPPRRKPWAWLLKHVFLHDVSVCPRCRVVGEGMGKGRDKDPEGKGHDQEPKGRSSQHETSDAAARPLVGPVAPHPPVVRPAECPYPGAMPFRDELHAAKRRIKALEEEVDGTVGRRTAKALACSRPIDGHPSATSSAAG